MKYINILVFLLVIPLAYLIGDDSGKLTIKEIYNSSIFRGESIENVHWSNDGEGIIFRESTRFGLSRDFIHYNIYTDIKSVFIDGSTIIDESKNEVFTPWNVIWSPNEKYLLFTDKLVARKTKSGGDFYLYDVQQNHLSRITDSQANQLNVKFSPDGEQIAFIRDNNLYLLDLDSKAEKQLTYDGREHILNGHFDWVYEEEFDIIEGWQWSADGKYIAYWQIDERQVPEFNIPIFKSLYPKSLTMRYPKAGEKNSKVRIGVVNIETGRNMWFQFGEESDIYIPRIQWLPNRKELAIMKLNRLQNFLQIYIGNVSNGLLRKIYEEQDDRWIEIKDEWLFLKSDDKYFWTSEKSGFRHIYLNDITDHQERQLTFGNWEVRKVVAVDEKKQLIYFTATKESPIENHLYRVSFSGLNVEKLSDEPGWHDPKFSPDKKFYVDHYSDIVTPTKTILHKSDGTKLGVLVQNENDVLKSYKMSKPQFIMVQIEDDITLNGWMLKPPDFDSDQEYPLVMFSYGGPGSQKVLNEWGKVLLWFHYLAQNGYVVACVDNRGTEGRGVDFKKCVYKKLGQIDVEDQIATAKYFAKLEYIDENRIGIYGWSYGGYMAAMCLMQGSEIFKVAVAVAPVTDWRFYDTIYTERFMQTPNLNKEGYELGSVLNYVNRLSGKLLLIHGMADDNVHFQNSAELADELIRQNKQFDTMFYPNRKHSIRRGSYNTREHLYTLITKFIFENL